MLHTRAAREAGESEDRLATLAAWEEAPWFTPRERAGLRWAEAVTNVQTGHVPDEVYEEARSQFSEAELVHLTMAVLAINAWNRLAISFRLPVAD